MAFGYDVSVWDALEVAHRLAMAATEWDVASAAWIPLVSAQAAVAAVLSKGDPLAGEGSNFFCAAPSADPFPLSSLARAVQRDIRAARRLEREQEHHVCVNPQFLQSPGGVDLVALANVVCMRDPALLRRHATVVALQASLGGERGLIGPGRQVRTADSMLPGRRLAAMLLSRYKIGPDGKAGYERRRGEKCRIPLAAFGEKVWCRKPEKAKAATTSI